MCRFVSRARRTWVRHTSENFRRSRTKYKLAWMRRTEFSHPILLRKSFFGFWLGCPGSFDISCQNTKSASSFNPLNFELNPICYLLALLGAHHFLHVSRIRVKLLTFRLLMSYIYGAPILVVSRSHTTTQHSR